MKLNSLAKNERLSHRKEIDLLFKKGKSIRFNYFRVFYLSLEKANSVPMQAFFSIPKRLHKRAVKRNLLKRRVKEAFRIHNHELKEFLANSDIAVNIGFVFTSDKEISFHDLELEMLEAMKKVSNRLQKF